jgi:hypothetical protein
VRHNLSLSLSNLLQLLRLQNEAVEQFVIKVDACLRRRNEREKLNSILSRIESYDVLESNNDEVEKVMARLLARHHTRRESVEFPAPSYQIKLIFHFRSLIKCDRSTAAS